MLPSRSHRPPTAPCKCSSYAPWISPYCSQCPLPVSAPSFRSSTARLAACTARVCQRQSGRGGMRGCGPRAHCAIGLASMGWDICAVVWNYGPLQVGSGAFVCCGCRRRPSERGRRRAPWSAPWRRVPTCTALPAYPGFRRSRLARVARLRPRGEAQRRRWAEAGNRRLPTIEREGFRSAA